MSTERYFIRLSPVWRVPLLIIAATRKRCFVELDDEEIRFNYSYVKLKVGLDEVVSVERHPWPFIYGIGVRWAPNQTVGLVGSTRGVVWVELKKARRMKVVPFNLNVRNIAVSCEDPDGFVKDLQRRLLGR